MICENSNKSSFSACERVPIKMERIKQALEIPNVIKSLVMNAADYIELASLCGFSPRDYKELANKYGISLSIQTGPGAIECGFLSVETWDSK